MKRAFVTGGTGFVGSNVIRELLNQGRKVRALVRPTSSLGNIKDLDIELIKGDLKDPISYRHAMKDIDEVYHVAAEYNFWARDPHEIYRANIDGTRNILEASLATGVKKVVYTSTVGTIGMDGKSAVFNETTPMLKNQLSGHYKKSKFQAEQVAIEFARRGLPLVIVNPSAPVGPWDRKPTPTGKIILDFLTGKMPAYLDTGLNIIHVSDVAKGHILAAERGKIGERYILGGQNMSLAEILECIGSIVGKKPPRFRIPYWLAYTVGMCETAIANNITHHPPAVPLEAVKMAKNHMYFDSSKAIQELGLPQTNPRKAFEDAVTWFAKNNYFDKNEISHEIRILKETN